MWNIISSRRKQKRVKAMRKKLGTRFPASRIKKIMQADEDVGKIALAVPLLVSKALELFLQDLCDRTYEITLQRGAKTLNTSHLYQTLGAWNLVKVKQGSAIGGRHCHMVMKKLRATRSS